MKRRVLALVLVFGAGCADTGGSAVGPEDTSACDGVQCPVGTTCVAGLCREGVDGDVGPDAVQDAADDAPEDAVDDVPDDVNGDADPAEDAADVADAPDEPDVPAPHAEVTVEPASLAMTVATEGEQIERNMTVFNVGNRAVQIVDVLSDHADLRIYDNPAGDVLQAAGGRANVTVRYTARSLAPVSTTLRILVDIPAVITVPVEVIAKQGDDPCIAVRPTRIDFGEVVRGQIETRQVTVENCGTAGLDVTDIQRGTFFGIPSPAQFQWSMTPPTPASLGPGERAMIDVTYEPGRVGLDLGFFNVRSTDAAEPEVRVDLVGRSAPPPIEDQDLHIQLDWDSDNCDVDLHFIREGSDLFRCGPDQDCYYANPTPDWGTQGDWHDDPFLDYDNVQGFGPENINVEVLLPGRYVVAIHYYLDSYEDSFSTQTNATVKIYFRGVLAGTYGPQHLVDTGDMWDVVAIDWPSRTLTPLGRIWETSDRSCR